MTGADFLFELGVEELPSQSVFTLGEALAANIKMALEKNQLSYQRIQSFASPRRISIIIFSLATKQNPQNIQRKGPAYAAAYDDNGNPTKALIGFAAACNTKIENLTILDTPKGKWTAFIKQISGQKSSILLPEIIKAAIKNLPITKHMRWGDSLVEFVRPIHWVLMLYNKKVIKDEIWGIKSANITYGHRFLHPQALKIEEPKLYEKVLKDAYVIADFEKRRFDILTQIKQLAAKLNATAIVPDPLLDEVTSIVEWPAALLANFNEEFLNIPAEILIAAMQKHQKCFALQTATGKLIPHFIIITNIISNNPNSIISGNEKVMHARLSDAAFFYHQDRKNKLIKHYAATANIIYHSKLGSLQDKTARMQQLIALLIQPLKLDPEIARRAVQLSKCDLLTGMVKEFPELQGTMGYYYSLNDKEPKALALALKEQYYPRFAADELPQSNLGLALSLVDRLDSLAGNFYLHAKNKSDKDPFKLRRNALAIARILLTISVPISLTWLITETVKIINLPLNSIADAAKEIKDYIIDRLQAYFLSQNYSIDVILAVLALQDDNLFDLKQRLQAVKDFCSQPESYVLGNMSKRVNNILQQMQFNLVNLHIDKNLLQENQEQKLYEILTELQIELKNLYQQANYSQILTNLTTLKQPLEDFFDKVLINVADPALKNNRLLLLIEIKNLLELAAKISLLQLK